MKPRHGIALVVCALCAGFSFAANAQKARELRTVSLAIGGKSQISYLPIILADRKGFFRDAGLKVDIKDFAGGPKSMEALVGGGVEFAAGAYENAIHLQAKGAAVKAVVLMANSIGVVIAVSKEKAARYKSPKDVKGLRFGVTSPGSSTHLALQLFLAKENLTNADVSVIGVGGGAGAIAAMRMGKLDGISQTDPVAAKLIHDGYVVPLVDTRTQKGLDYLYGGPIAASSVLTRPDFIKEHPEAVQACVDAMVHALKWLHSASKAEIMAAVPPEFYGREKDTYERSLGAAMPIFPHNGMIPAANAENTLRILVAAGRISKDRKINLGATYDNSFAEQANRK